MNAYFDFSTLGKTSKNECCKKHIYHSPRIDINLYRQKIDENKSSFIINHENTLLHFLFNISKKSDIFIHNQNIYINNMDYIFTTNKPCIFDIPCQQHQDIKLMEINIKSEKICSIFKDKNTDYNIIVNNIHLNKNHISPHMQLSLHKIISFNDSYQLKNIFYTAESMKILSYHIEKCTLYALLKNSNNVHFLKIYEAQELMENNLNNSLTLTGISEKIGLSTPHFKRIFQQMTGTTPYVFLTRKRMEFALSLLTETSKNINEIAAMVGYKSNSHFTKAFTSYFSKKPSVFRKRYISSENS